MPLIESEVSWKCLQGFGVAVEDLVVNSGQARMGDGGLGIGSI